MAFLQKSGIAMPIAPTREHSSHRILLECLTLGSVEQDEFKSCWTPCYFPIVASLPP